MDENIKKIISEAFNELYSEMMSEAPETLKKNTISDNEVEDIVDRAKRTGRGLSYDWTEGEESQQNFNDIIDMLIADYQENQNEKSKRAIQNAFAPNNLNGGNKIFKLAAGQLKGMDDIEDAVMYAYGQVLLDNFEGLLNSYRGDGTFSGLVARSLNNRAKNYLFKKNKTRGITGMGDEEKSAFGGPSSFETPAGEKRTLGDTVAGTPLDTGFQGDENAPIKRQIVDTILGWLENNLENKEFPGVTPKRLLAVKLLLQGVPASQIIKEYPEIFKDGKGNNSPTVMFYQIANSPAGKEISDIVSHEFSDYIGNWKMSDVDPNRLEATSSMSPEWGGHSRPIEKFTPEMKNLRKKLEDALNSLGLTRSDFDSDKKIIKIIQSLRSGGQEAEAENIENIFDELSDAKEAARERGEFQKDTAVLPKSEKEELSSDEFGGMFEGISERDVEKLMERVLRRLSR